MRHDRQTIRDAMAAALNKGRGVDLDDAHACAMAYLREEIQGYTLVDHVEAVRLARARRRVNGERCLCNLALLLAITAVISHAVVPANAGDGPPPHDSLLGGWLVFVLTLVVVAALSGAFPKRLRRRRQGDD